MKKEISKRIVEIGIIPVLNIKNPDHAVDLARAIVEGGIPVIEVTMREESSLQSLRNIRAAFPGILVGAGTILRTEQVDAAIEAGADFLVAPGFNPTTVRYCRDRDIEIFPGAVTASEIEQGIELGLSIFKFFPIEQAGGLAMIDSFKGPFSNIRFIPTGGVSLKNLHLYMEHSSIAAVGGSFMADRATVDACDWAGVTKACQTAVNISLGFSLAHIGINHENAEQALATAKWFFDLFGFPIKDGNSSVFSGAFVESMKSMYLGKKGHIGIGTRSVTRAMAFLAERGVEFHEYKYNAQGKLVAAYLKENVAGFAVHIVQI